MYSRARFIVCTCAIVSRPLVVSLCPSPIMGTEMTVLYRETDLRFLVKDEAIHHLGKYTAGELLTSICQSIPVLLALMGTLLVGALEAFERFCSPCAHRTRNKRICCFVNLSITIRYLEVEESSHMSLTKCLVDGILRFTYIRAFKLRSGKRKSKEHPPVAMNIYLRICYCCSLRLEILLNINVLSKL